MPAIDAPKTRLAPNFSDRRPPGTKSIENTNAQFYFQSIENTNAQFYFQSIENTN